jgi:hypothetical protein
MENKKFNYIEFKMDIVNNELMFLERYLTTKSDKIKVNDIKLIKSTITKLQSILIKCEEQYVKKEIRNHKEENINHKEETETVKLTINTHEDILKYNTDLVNKIYQINYII